MYKHLKKYEQFNLLNERYKYTIEDILKYLDPYLDKEGVYAKNIVDVNLSDNKIIVELDIPSGFDGGKNERDRIKSFLLRRGFSKIDTSIFELDIKKFENFDWDEDDFDFEEDIPVDMVFNKEFTQFLIDNDAYDNYLYSMEKIKGCKNTDAINNKLRGLRNHQVIDISFGWSGTPQGHTYWEKLNNKWIESSNLFENIDPFDEENWDEEEFEFDFEKLTKKFLDKLCWDHYYVYLKKINLGYCDYDITELDEKNLIVEADINYGVQGEYEEKNYVVANKRAMVDYLNGIKIISTGDSEEDGPYLDMGA